MQYHDRIRVNWDKLHHISTQLHNLERILRKEENRRAQEASAFQIHHREMIKK